jgi:hypothetical protein
MSSRMAPWMLKEGWMEASTARWCMIRAPRSWPVRIMGVGVEEGIDGRREERVVRREVPVLRLSWGPGRGEERP